MRHPTDGVLRRLVDRGLDAVVPVVPDDVGPDHPLMADLRSGYLTRAAHLMPRATDSYPWAMAQNVVRDGWATSRADLDEGLRWSRAAGEGRTGEDRARGSGPWPAQDGARRSS